MQRVTIAHISNIMRRGESLDSQTMWNTSTEELQAVYSYFTSQPSLAMFGNVLKLGFILNKINCEIQWREGSYLDITPDYYEKL